jgi:hypothetical protein
MLCLRLPWWCIRLRFCCGCSHLLLALHQLHHLALWLLASLDRVFGMTNKERSTFKKISQEFDEKTNEHVIVIEYRVRVKGTLV